MQHGLRGLLIPSPVSITEVHRLKEWLGLGGIQEVQHKILTLYLVDRKLLINVLNYNKQVPHGNQEILFHGEAD